MGKLIAANMGWKYAPDILVRKRHGVPQTELTGKERKSKIKGIFEFNDFYSQLTTHLPAQAGSSRLVLFDDVWTTGSTLKEAAKVLKRRGAGEVWGLTIAG